MSIDLGGIVKGAECGHIIVHPIGSVHDSLTAASRRPGETEGRCDVGVVVWHIARERIGRLSVKGGEKNGFIAGANVNAEIGAETDLILPKKGKKGERDTAIRIAAVGRKEGVGVVQGRRGI